MCFLTIILINADGFQGVNLTANNEGIEMKNGGENTRYPTVPSRARRARGRRGSEERGPELRLA